MAVRNRVMCDGQRAGNVHVAEWIAVKGEKCVRERQRAGNAPVAEWIAVERGEARQRDAENGQRPCSRMDSGGKGKWASEKGRERATHL